MGLFLRQDGSRSELQSKVATDLRERLKQRQIDTEEHEPTITEDQHETRLAGVFIAILLLVLLGVLLFWLLRLGGII